MKLCPQCKSEYEAGEQFCPIDGARLSTDQELGRGDFVDPLVGKVLAARYKILRVVGAGGMGVVYEAEHTVIGKHVAVKVLRNEVSEKPDVLERFKQEAKSASKIGHENIIDISDFGETPDGSAFLVMEMLDGRDLAHVLQERRTLPVERAVPILVQCCKALGAAHDKGIIHRDMKPENVFLVNREDQPDFVKIVDFGIAKMSDLETPGEPGRKLTKTGMIFGTPEYMSPEQAYGRPTDHRVDIYAMGIIAYEIFAGRVPFVGESFMAILSQHMLETPLPIRSLNPHSTIPAAVEHVVYRCLEKDPNDRPPTMRDLAYELLHAIGASGLNLLPMNPSGSMPVPSSGGHQTREPRSMAPSPSRFGAATPIPPSGGVGSSAPPPASMRPEAGRYGTALLGGSGPNHIPSIETLAPEADRRPSRLGPLLLMLAIVVGVGGAATYWLLSPGPVSPAEARVDAGPAIATPPPTSDAGAQAETPPPAVDAGQPVEIVTVVVTSIPREAEVKIGNRVVCASTPCPARVPRGEEVTFELTRGRMSGSGTITPVADTEYLDIRLRTSGWSPPGDPPTMDLSMDLTMDVGPTMMTLITPDLRIPPELR